MPIFSFKTVSFIFEIPLQRKANQFLEQSYFQEEHQQAWTNTEEPSKKLLERRMSKQKSVSLSSKGLLTIF